MIDFYRNNTSTDNEAVQFANEKERCITVVQKPDRNSRAHSGDRDVTYYVLVVVEGIIRKLTADRHID